MIQYTRSTYYIDDVFIITLALIFVHNFTYITPKCATTDVRFRILAPLASDAIVFITLHKLMFGNVNAKFLIKMVTGELLITQKQLHVLEL